METELFVHFAEIAGVFVGFGALIGLRSAEVRDPHDVVYMQAVVGIGVWVIVSALVPIAVSSFGVAGPSLWVSCAVLATALWVLFVVMLNISSESKQITRRPESVDRHFPIVGLPLHIVIVASLLVTVVGLWPAADEALYVTALTAGVTFACYTLLACLLSQRHESERDVHRTTTAR
jgi:hypothetical protein